MKKILAYGGSALAIATGFALLYKSSSSIRYKNFKILDKQSLIFILKQVRSEYSQKFSVQLRLNRKKRRNLHRAGREYKNLVKELKDQSKEYIQKAREAILEIYIGRVEELNETNANELNLQLKVLEDDLFDEFGFEPEEVEEALRKNQKDFVGFMKTINELNDELLSKTKQEIFY